MVHCEDVGCWENFGIPIACPIEQHVFQDCTDLCTLAIRLLTRYTITLEFLKVTQKGIEDCRDECLYVYQKGKLKNHHEIHLVTVVTAFDIAINEINQLIQAESNTLDHLGDSQN